MAANAIAVRNALQRIGFTQAAAQSIVTDQGIDDASEVALLNDEEVTNLCKVVRRPGGAVANPDANAQGQPAQIPNNGHQVSLRAENNLKLTSYYLRHRIRISRPLAMNDVDLATIRGMRALKESEEAHEDPDAPEFNPKNWTKTLEDIVEHLGSVLGVTGIPLAYVLRTEEAVTPAADDAADNYATPREEMIARAPIRTGGADTPFTPTYQADVEKVWEIISSLTRDKDCWTYVKPAQRRKDGRAAYWNLHNHYLGPGNVDNMANAAERKLQRTTYIGEKKRWNWEKYTKVHADQHQILNDLVEHGYSGIDERSKVRHLIDGIKTPKLDSVKTQVMASPTLRTDYDAVVQLYKDFIEQQATDDKQDIQVASVETKAGSKRGPETGVEYRYHTSKEYEDLSGPERSELAQMREADPDYVPKSNKRRRTKKGGQGQGKGNGANNGNGKGKGKGNGDKAMKALTRKVAALTAALEKKQVSFDSDDDDMDTDDESDKKKKKTGGGNRNNSALTRQRT